MGCGCGGCESLNTGILPTGNTGAKGANGDQGLYGGFSGDWMFDTTSTGGAPIDTFLRFNGLTVSANVTTITVAETGPGLVNYSDFLNSLSNNSKYGYIRIFKTDDSTKFWMGRITNVVDSGTYSTITVVYISASNAAITSIFGASDSIVLTFSPAGAASPSILSNNTTAVSTSAGIMTSLMSYTLPAGQLKTNDDTLEVVFAIDSNLTTEIKRAELRLAGVICHSKATTFNLNSGSKYMSLIAVITRQTATSVFIKFDIVTSSARYTLTNGQNFFETSIPVNDLDSLTNVIELFGRNSSGGSQTIRANQMLVKYYNKL
jgi:hypothetical protein